MRSPPLCRSASCAPLRGSVGARWPRLALAPALLRFGLPIRSPLLRRGLGPLPARGLAGGSASAPSGASGPGAPGPAPRRGLWAALSFSGAGRFWLRAALPLGGLSVGLCAVFRRYTFRGVLPCAPRPAAPAGGSGERVARLGASPPLRGSRFSRPSCGPPAALRAAPCGLSARLSIRKLSTGS